MTESSRLPAQPSASNAARQSTVVLALDAGQTGVRAEHRRGAEVLTHSEYAGVLTDRPVLPQLAQIALEAQQTSPQPAEVLAVGSSGLTDDMQATSLLQLVEGSGLRRVCLAHDSVTSYLGAIGDVPGVVTAAGTGVVTLGVGEAEVARVDGWGNLLGDAGSGYWIGRAGLEAVMRAHDGRGPATALTDPVRAEFPDLEAAYMVLQADEHRVSRIAAWARVIAELAADDEVCRGICEQAGRELACSALTALRRVGQDQRLDPLVGTVGNVFRSEKILSSFTAAVRDRHPKVRLAPAGGTGLDGAALLPFVHSGFAMTPLIRTA